MGRKSAKTKEKISQRKENKQLTDHYWDLITEAKKADPLSTLVSFQKYKKCDLNINISCDTYPHIGKDVINWAFEMTKKNMELLYVKSGWRWNSSSKLKELKDSNARYLIARNENEKPVAFIHFRFDLDDGLPVLYCYEIHIEPEVQRKGLGFFMMQILQLMAIKYHMVKVVATVLKLNQVSMDFFTKKLRFKEDDTCPSDESYLILSKMAKTN